MFLPGVEGEEWDMRLSPAPLSDRFENVVDLGQGHSFVWLWRRPVDWPDDRPWVATDGLFPDDVFAIVEQHPFLDDPSRFCEGIVYLRHPYDHLTAHVWKVHSWDPLDIDPSVLCEACGSHGFIRDGKWDSL